MSLSFGFFTFLNAWFLMFFFVLPFFVHPAKEHTAVEYAAAPQPLRWKKLLLTNTLVSIVATLVMALIIHSHLFVMRGALS